MANTPKLLGPEVDDDPRLVRAAGVLVLRGAPQPGGGFATGTPCEVLLLRRPSWWDLPKGHVDPGEDEPTAALRELEEETSLSAGEVSLIDGFQWDTHYEVAERQHGGETRPKRIRFFAAWCLVDKPLVMTEHVGYEWHAWSPPHRIQPFTIDPLLKAAEDWLAE